jgi:ECF-type riboflavin transporter, S component
LVDNIGSITDSRNIGPEIPKEIGPSTSSRPVIELARIGAFSALVAVGTILSNGLFGVPLPPPLTEITVAPAFYLAIAVLFSRRVSFWSTFIGSAIGETVNVLFFGGVPAAFLLTYVPGIILARAPEALIIHKFRQSTTRIIAMAMVVATVYETIVFFIIDWFVYSFTTFYCTPPCSSAGLTGGFLLASFDFATMVDVFWIPVSLSLVIAARRAYNRSFFD